MAMRSVVRMYFLAGLCSAWFWTDSASAQQVHLVAPTEPLTPAQQREKFHLPPGFEIELIASEPEIPKPINICFDASGALLVSSSTEYPFPAEGREPKDTIRRIIDSNGDGVPDKVTVFAQGLNIPIGVTPVGDGVIGYGIPTINKFQDRDGDGKADDRQPMYQTFGSRDTHGMASSFTWWLDGWVYACHGFSNESKVAGADGQPIVMQSGNTYRFRPDGSHIEYFTHGQVNPFGMTVDEYGNLYSADCHSKPITMLLRGAYYQSFGKPHDGLGYGPDMIAHSHGSTGICGLAFYGAKNFPAAYHGTVFIGNPVTGRVNRDQLAPHGSSRTAVEQPDFLSCDDPWFRPVDLKLAMDGSLYVADFYNRIIGHYEVPLTHPQRDRERGRIWRIVYRGDGGQAHASTGDLTKASAEKLVELLSADNIVTRTQAVHQLVHRIGTPAVRLVEPLIQSGSESIATAYGLWVIERLRGLNESELQLLAQNRSAIVRTYLLKLLADRPKWTTSHQKLATSLLADSDATVQRAAADALGQHADPTLIVPLLKNWKSAAEDDLQLIHMVRMSLRNQLLATADWSGTLNALALDPNDRQRLTSLFPGVANVNVAQYLQTELQADRFPLADQQDLVEHAVRYASPDQAAVLTEIVIGRLKPLSSGQQVALLRGLQRAWQRRGTAIPDQALVTADLLATTLLSARPEGDLRNGLELSRDLRLNSQADRILALALPGSPAPPVRPLAIETLLAINQPAAIAALSKGISEATLPLDQRQRWAEQLGGLNHADARKGIADLWKAVPESVALSLARGLAGYRDGLQLLEASARSGATTPRLLRDGVVQGKLKAVNDANLSRQIEELLRDVPSEDERLTKLLTARSAGWQSAKGDHTRGAAVFKKHCASCHRVGGEGGKVGPELDGVGVRGAERLLEDTLVPSRNVDQAFRARVYQLANGTTVSGLPLREEGEVVVIANDQGKEVRLEKKEIEESRQLLLSAMPANLAEQIPEAEYFDLLAYLLQQKSTPPRPER